MSTRVFQQSNRFSEIIAENSVAYHHDLIIADAVDGEITLDYVFLTSHGVIVIDVLEIEGQVFSASKIESWSIAEFDHRFQLPNPLFALRDRITAVSALLAPVPVRGFVGVSNTVDFVTERPKLIITPNELRERLTDQTDAYRLPEVAAFLPYWDRLSK